MGGTNPSGGGERVRSLVIQCVWGGATVASGKSEKAAELSRGEPKVFQRDYGRLRIGAGR